MFPLKQTAFLRVWYVELAVRCWEWISNKRVVKQLRYSCDRSRHVSHLVTSDRHGSVLHHIRSQTASVQTMEVHRRLTFDL